MTTANNDLVRRDFLVFFDVKDGNPNGDPDAGNLPRTDPETGHGLVTDVCIKRKIRNYVATSRAGQAGHGIFIADKAILNHTIEAAAKELGVQAEAEPETEEGEESDTGDEAPEATASQRRGGKAGKGSKAGKGGKKLDGDATVDKFRTQLAEQQRVQNLLCERYYDLRAFGAVLSTGGFKAGQVRGPVQFAFARSIDPILTLEHSITRMAVTKAEDALKERTMGRKNTVPYGLYCAPGFFSPALALRDSQRKAQGTGFSQADLDLLWEALENMFEHDHSAARGTMTTRALIIFEHPSALGVARASELFDRVVAERRSADSVPRSFKDYKLTLDGQELSGLRTLVKVRREEASGVVLDWGRPRAAE